MSVRKSPSAQFDNENTWDKAVKAGKEEKFHESYEKAVSKLRQHRKLLPVGARHLGRLG